MRSIVRGQSRWLGLLIGVADDSPMVPDLLAWTQARFAGDPPASACQTIAG